MLEKLTEVAIKETLKNRKLSPDQKLIKAAESQNRFKGLHRSNSISFGSLANGAFKNNVNYLQWKDGIDWNELNEDWIGQLADEISAIYGINGIKVFEEFGSYSAGINPDWKTIFYDPAYLKVNGNKYGIDNVIKTLSHEIGHQLFTDVGFEKFLNDYFEDPVNKKKLEEIFKDIPKPEEPENYSSYINEACADYIAGLTARLCKVDPTQMLLWYDSRSKYCRDGVHPGSSIRMEMFMRGLTRIDRGEEARILKTFEAFSPYDLEGTYKNADTMRRVLIEDVINPFLNGEIKPV